MRDTPFPPAAAAALLALLFAPRGEAVGPPCGTLVELRSRLAAAPDEGARSSAAAAVAACAVRHGTPLLSPAGAPGRLRALFLYRSAAPRVFLAGDTNGWSTAATPLEKLPGTDLHALELEVPDGARLDYKLVVGGTEWTLDPWNPRTMAGGYGPNSELRTPGYVPPPEVEPAAGTPRGRYEELTVESRALGATRRALVWVPPGGPHGAAPLPVLYLFDGLDYREFAKVHTVAENLLAAGRIPPLLLVLVPPVDRRAEYESGFWTTPAPGAEADGPAGRAEPGRPAGRRAFERYLATELVPAVEARWNVRRDAAGRGVMGVSLGGFAALSATARNPGLFGRCGAQSTGNAVPANLEALLARLARLPGTVRFHVDVGTFESDLHGADLLAVSRRLRDTLARRHPLQYREVPEGHSWGSWRARLAEALTFFWGDALPRAPSGPRVLAAPPGGADRFSGAPVTLDVKDAELADVVRRLTDGRGLSVAAPAALAGTVTASLRGVPWDQALDLVLAGNGWAFVREGNVIRVFRRDAPDR